MEEKETEKERVEEYTLAKGVAVNSPTTDPIVQEEFIIVLRERMMA